MVSYFTGKHHDWILKKNKKKSVNFVVCLLIIGNHNLYTGIITNMSECVFFEPSIKQWPMHGYNNIFLKSRYEDIVNKRYTMYP